MKINNPDLIKKYKAKVAAYAHRLMDEYERDKLMYLRQAEARWHQNVRWYKLLWWNFLKRIYCLVVGERFEEYGYED